MGQRVGKFEIVEELGRGGMGVVYKAVDPGIERTVALKVLPPSHTQDAELRERFLREARAAGRLQHPNIVVIHEIGEDQGNLYIAMEYLEGETLAERIARERGRGDVASALEVMAQVGRGLNYAHERGVVHRDIKPANILVTREGTAKILDFGIARAGDKRMTKTGQVMGTIYYMSPEQINGQQLDGRSDIFSAGIVLYELLTGDVPFDEESTGATMMKILTAPAPPLGERAPMSPPVLEEIVARALAKQPAERYPNAAEFAAALEAAKAQCTPTKPVEAPTRPAKAMAISAGAEVASPAGEQATVLHQEKRAGSHIELEEFKGWKEDGARSGRLNSAEAATSPLVPPSRPSPVMGLEATGPVPAIRFRWWHVIWPRMDHELGAKVACRVSAGGAFLLAAILSLLTLSLFTDQKRDPNGVLALAAMTVGYVVAGSLLVRFSRVAALLPALGAVGVTTALLLAPGGDSVAKFIVGTFMFLLFVPGMRGSVAYQRLRPWPRPAQWWHVAWPSASDGEAAAFASRLGAAATFFIACATGLLALEELAAMQPWYDAEQTCESALLGFVIALTFLLLARHYLRFSRAVAIATPLLAAVALMAELEYGRGRLSELDRPSAAALVVLVVLAALLLIGIRGTFSYQRARQANAGLANSGPRMSDRFAFSVGAYLLLLGGAYLLTYQVWLPRAVDTIERALLREQPEIKPYLKPVLGLPEYVVPGYYAGSSWNASTFTGSKIEMVIAEGTSSGITTPLRGCVGFHRPLSGSGKLSGFHEGNAYTFSVESSEWTITFSGSRQGKTIQGTYVAKNHAGAVAEQQGTFELERQIYSVNDGFTAESCPTDDVIR